MTKHQPAHREGLRFKKLDLHLHTPASNCFADRSVVPRAIVEAAIAKGLHAIAVTDHNSGAWIDHIKAAAEGSGLFVFPGVEITCMAGKDGIHMIALFDVDAGTKEVESLLGNLGLKPSQYGDIHTVVQKDPLSVAAIIAERRGLAILAHANSSKGALQDMRGEQRTALIQWPAVRAAEGTDFQDSHAKENHKRVVDLLDGTDPTFKQRKATSAPNNRLRR